MKLPSVTQAFLLHFAISLIIFLALVAIMLKVWFPHGLFMLDGGWQGLKIIAPIDLILGPALTLLFYRPAKKNIAFDMSCIAAVQIAALGFGVATAHEQRTAAIVFAENRFETISLQTYRAASSELEENGIEARPISDFGQKMPLLLFAKPYDKSNYDEYLASLLNGMPELRERSDRYQTAATAREQIIASQNTELMEQPASFNRSTDPNNKPLQSVEQTYVLKARYGTAKIILDGDSFSVKRIEPDPT